MKENETENLGIGKEKGNKKFLTLLFIAIVLIVVACITYVAMLSNPKKVFTIALDKVFASANTSLKENKNAIFGSMAIKTDMNSENKEANQILSIFNNLDFNLNYEVDYTKNRMYMEIDTKYNQKDLIQANMYTENKDIYIDLKDVFDKYIHIPIDTEINLNSNKERIAAYQVVLEEIDKALTKSLKEKYFTSENTKIMINKKDTKVTKNSLILNQTNLEEMIKNMAKELNNKKFIDAFAKITDQDSDTIKEFLEKATKENLELEETNMTISIFTKGLTKDFVGLEIKESNDWFSIIKDTDKKCSYELSTDNKKIVGSIESQTEKEKSNVSITFDYDSTKGSITLNHSYTTKGTLNSKNVDEAIDINVLTKKDLENMYTNITNKEGITEFIEDLMHSFNTSSSSL